LRWRWRRPAGPEAEWFTGAVASTAEPARSLVDESLLFANFFDERLGDIVVI
jgi:hypothetical protein